MLRLGGAAVVVEAERDVAGGRGGSRHRLFAGAAMLAPAEPKSRQGSHQEIHFIPPFSIRVSQIVASFYKSRLQMLQMWFRKTMLVIA